MRISEVCSPSAGEAESAGGDESLLGRGDLFTVAIYQSSRFVTDLSNVDVGVFDSHKAGIKAEHVGVVGFTNAVLTQARATDRLVLFGGQLVLHRKHHGVAARAQRIKKAVEIPHQIRCGKVT